MNTTAELSQMLDEIAKSADWHESLDTVSIARISSAAQRLRELDKPDCAWTCTPNTPTPYKANCGGQQFVNWSKYCPNCGGAVKEGV